MSDKGSGVSGSCCSVISPDANGDKNGDDFSLLYICHNSHATVEDLNLLTITSALTCHPTHLLDLSEMK